MWKKEYLKLLLSMNNKNLDNKELNDLKLKNMPKSLYKYQKIDVFTLANLENDVAFFRKAIDFNDPYDSALTLDGLEFFDEEDGIIRSISKVFNVSFNEVKNMLIKYPAKEVYRILIDKHPKYKNSLIGKKFFEQISKQIDDANNNLVSKLSEFYQEKIFVSCFSELSTSMLMWSHYADYHKGMVVEYEFKNTDVSDYLYPILYTDELLKLTSYRELTEIQDLYKVVSIIKSEEWSYEKEWRLIQLAESNEPGLIRKILKPKRIILGARVSKQHKIMLSLECLKKGVPIQQIKLDRFNYKLIVEEVNLDE